MKMGSRMEEGNAYSRTGRTRENGKMAKGTARELANGMMENHTRDNTKATK